MKHMIGRQHDLLGFDAELVGGLFDGVDGSAVDVGLAGFAKTAVIGVDAEALQQGFQRRGAAVHVGGLDDLGNEEPAPWSHGWLSPAARRAIVAGEIRSISSSTARGAASAFACCEI